MSRYLAGLFTAPSEPMGDQVFTRWALFGGTCTLNEWWPGCDRESVRRDQITEIVVALAREIPL